WETKARMHADRCDWISRHQCRKKTRNEQHERDRKHEHELIQERIANVDRDQRPRVRREHAEPRSEVIAVLAQETNRTRLVRVRGVMLVVAPAARGPGELALELPIVLLVEAQPWLELLLLRIVDFATARESALAQRGQPTADVAAARDRGQVVDVAQQTVACKRL